MACSALRQQIAIRHRWVIVCALATLLPTNGCKEADEIRAYSVAKPPLPAKSHRMLAAVVPDEPPSQEKPASPAEKADTDGERPKQSPLPQAWFFKVVGPVSQVDVAAAAFDQFVASVRTDQEGLPKWELPQGWTVAPAETQEFGRAATIRIGESQPPLELAVSKLPMPENGRESWLLGNINRWRSQLQLPPIGRSELDDSTIKVTAGEVTAVKVDLRGTFSGGPRAGMLAGNEARGNPHPATVQPQARPANAVGDPAGGAKASLPFESEVPGDWKPGRMNEFRVAAYNVGGDEAGGAAELTVTPLGPAAGDLKANVDRWRAEIKLPPSSSGELQELTKSIEVDGVKADYVHLVGTAEAAPREATLGVILRRPDRVWFFKLRGPANTVEGHKEQFEAYVKSVKFK
jgi:hypothetical protein